MNSNYFAVCATCMISEIMTVTMVTNLFETSMKNQFAVLVSLVTICRAKIDDICKILADLK